MPKLYDELAPWWPLLSPPEEYVEEAAFFAQLLEKAGDQPCRTLLELGSGGGNNASHLKARFDLTLVDPSPQMLAVSRTLNPTCEHFEGDMRTIRLGREFDRVFVHDAICYMTTAADLRRAIETAHAHCRRGGAAVFVPDHLRENFEESSDHGGSEVMCGRCDTSNGPGTLIRTIRSTRWTMPICYATRMDRCEWCTTGTWRVCSTGAVVADPR